MESPKGFPEPPKGHPHRASYLLFKWRNTELTEEETEEMLSIDPLFPWRRKPARKPGEKCYEIARWPRKDKS